MDRLEFTLAKYTALNSMNDTHTPAAPQKPPLSVAYFEGAYGATLRFDVQDLNILAQFKDSIQRLSSGHLKRFCVEELLSVAMSPNVKSIVLIAADDRGEQRIGRFGEGGRQTTFRWTQNTAGWDNTAGLIEGLYRAGLRGQSGHQYLTDQTQEIVVEVALWE